MQNEHNTLPTLAHGIPNVLDLIHEETFTKTTSAIPHSRKYSIMNHVRRFISATVRKHFGPLAGRSRFMRDWKQGSALGISAKCMEKVGPYCCKGNDIQRACGTGIK